MDDPVVYLLLFFIGLSLLIILLILPKIQREVLVELKKYIDEQIEKKLKI
jgi:hypothetical protein